MKALILAGGRGKRLNELTRDRNKSMVELFSRPIIEHNLDECIEIGVSEIILVLYYRPEEIMRYIGKDYKGVRVRYMIEKRGKGLVTAIENAKELIGDSDFILMLADEIVVDAKLKDMLKRFRDENLFAICGVIFEKDLGSIGKTYTAMVNEKGRAFRLIEKPKVKIDNIKGTGHCILKNEILDYIPRTPINAIRGQKELVDLIQVAIDDGKNVEIFHIAKDYVNINTKEDLNLAKEMIKKNNPRVLIVHNQMKYYGGGELLIVEMANWLTKRGIKNDILCLSSSKEVEDKLMNTEIIIPKHNVDLRPPGYKNMKDILMAIKAFRRKLKEIYKNYDVINFHDFPTTWTLFPRRKPAVWFMNLPPNLYSKPDAGFFYKTLNKFRIWLDRFIVRYSIDIITVAESMNQVRARRRYGRGSRLIDFGINYDFFSKGNAERARKKFNLKDRFVLIHSGILCNVKNQFESVKTIAKVKDKIPNILLILTGKEDPEYRKKLEEYVKEKKIEKNVLFAGYLATREELRDLYKAADVGLFPIGKQGGVLAPLEALCAGIPIVVSEEMETASLIKQNDLGIVTKDYANTILDIYNNQKEHKEKAKKAAIFVKKNLSWKIFTERMLKAYKDAWKKNKTVD